MFAPVAMRVHPIFTDVKDWTGDGRADGIEALVEFEDQFGDPTKASGEKGKQIWDLMVRNLVAFVETLQGTSLDELLHRQSRRR